MGTVRGMMGILSKVKERRGHSRQMGHLGEMYLKTCLNMERLEIPSPLRLKHRLHESDMEIVAGRSEFILYHIKGDGL